MSYPRDLDDYDDEELQGELDRRAHQRSRGLCDYCGGKQGVQPSCKYEERHKKPKA